MRVVCLVSVDDLLFIDNLPKLLTTRMEMKPNSPFLFFCLSYPLCYV